MHRLFPASSCALASAELRPEGPDRDWSGGSSQIDSHQLAAATRS